MAQSISVRDQHTWSNLAPYVLSILRIVVALLFFEHGLSKLFGFPQASPYPALFSLSWFAAAIEFIGGGLLAVGLFSRTAAFIMSGEMAFAYFISHAPHDFFPIINRAMPRFFTALSFSTSPSPAAGRGASMRSWRARNPGRR